MSILALSRQAALQHALTDCLVAFPSKPLPADLTKFHEDEVRELHIQNNLVRKNKLCAWDTVLISCCQFGAILFRAFTALLYLCHK